MTDTNDAFRPVVVVRCEVQHQGKILLLKRSTTVTRPGQWELPGGKLDKGESLMQAAQREAREETGLTVQVGGILADWISPADEIVGVIFEARATDDSITISDEHDDYLWVDANNLNSIEVDSGYKEYLSNRLDKSHTVENKSTISVNELIIFTDGGSRGNPGPSATGYVIYNTDQQEIAQGGTYLGITTNNQAEYHALLEAAQAALTYEPKKIKFYLDSQLVVNQMTGKYKIRNKDLWPVHQSIKDTLSGVRVEFHYVPREENSAADAMVNKVLDDRKNPVE